jgi:hypothetical protein
MGTEESPTRGQRETESGEEDSMAGGKELKVPVQGTES